MTTISPVATTPDDIDATSARNFSNQANGWATDANALVETVRAQAKLYPQNAAFLNALATEVQKYADSANTDASQATGQANSAELLAGDEAPQVYVTDAALSAYAGDYNARQALSNEISFLDNNGDYVSNLAPVSGPLPQVPLPTLPTQNSPQVT
jgi:hypothetical protein